MAVIMRGMRQLLVLGSLISLCLLILINPVASRVLINSPTHSSGSPKYSNEYILPSVPAKLSENNNQNVRSGLLSRRADSVTRPAAQVALGNSFKQNINLISSNLFFFGGYAPLPQRVYQLLDIPPPLCIVS
jgi:hypothetical protein